MEMEDEIIAKKLSALNTLPEGYEPNLESKWILLETGLKRRKIPFIINYRWLSIAAMLLLTFSAGFWYLLQHTAEPIIVLKKTTVQPIKNNIEKPMLITNNRNQLPEQSKIKLPPTHYRENSKKINQESLTITEEKIIASDTILEEQQLVIQEAKPEKATLKKPRYVQIDFFDSIHRMPESVEVTASIKNSKLKFHSNLFMNNGAKPTESNSIKILTLNF